MDYDLILSDISDILRRYCKRDPEISAEEAYKQIKEIIREKERKEA